ncbi:hydrolase [Camelimonas fluminis]|nr:hydrolase [Camelimonas fluminis]
MARVLTAVFLLLCLIAPAGAETPMATTPDAGKAGLAGRKPLVIAHRGASGYLPDHTIAAYRRAIDMGADFIEPDVVSTRDGVLVVRHEPMLSQTTNVADLPEFAARRRTMLLDGVAVTDWFTTDFTLAELKTLRARQPMAWRDQGHNDRYGVATLQEVIDLAKTESARLGRGIGREIGIAPETKHPTWHAAQGLPLEDRLVATLDAAGWKDRAAPVIIQSFETGNLRYLRRRTGVRLLQLVDGGGPDAAGAMTLAPDNMRPYDWTVTGDSRTWADLLTPAGLADVKTWADYVAPWKLWLIPTRAATVGDGVAPDAAGEGARLTLPPTGIVRDAHAVGLGVVTWTLRSEPRFLAASYGGDPAKEVQAFIDLGVDGLFSDFPDVAVTARDAARR